MAQSNPTRLAFDDVAIDLAGHRLLRAGVEQPLEPKAFGVLALLAGSPGRVFARDEILDAVWGHRHITPGVLNRVMTLLRHALGEEAHTPRYLHTLHGVGYRFDLPAVPAEVMSNPASVDFVEPVPDLGAAGSEPRTETPAPVGSFQRRETDRTRPRSRWHLVLWALPLLVLLAFVGWRLWPRAEPAIIAETPVIAEPAATPTLVVMPLKPIGEGSDVRTIADGLSEELIGGLAQIQGLRVIARESTRLAAAESTESTLLAKRLGITHLLEGSLQQAGQSLRVRLRLVDARGGGALWAKDFDRDASEVLLMQREIAQAVAASLTLKLGLSTDPQKSGDAGFLRRYLAARGLLESGGFMASLEDAQRAEAEFRALLRERQDDARANAGLAMALTTRAIRTPALARAMREEILHEAGIAQQLDPTLPEPYWLLAREACAVNEWERCLELQAKAARMAPSNAEAILGYQFILARLGYLDRAEMATRELAVRDPINTRPRFILGRLLDTQGRHDEARIELEKTGARGAYARWFNAVWRGDHAAALRIAETQIGSPDNDDPNAALLVPGYLAASRALIDPKLWPQALAEFDRYERKSVFWNFSRVLAPGAPAHAAEFIRKLNQVRQRNYSSWDLLLWTKELAFLRRDTAFQDYLRSSGILAYWRKHGFPKQCRPQGDGAFCE